MPEGDVLRRTADRFELAFGGRVLVRSDLRWPTAATVDLVGRTVLETGSYGKHLLTRFDDGRTLHTHLRMDGYWRIARTGTPASAAPGDHTSARCSPRREWTTVGYHLGMLDVVRTRDEHTLIGHLGPDMLARDRSTSTRRCVAGRPEESTPVAEVMLDQTVVAGIGTIFAAESLLAERLWPWTPADQVRRVPAARGGAAPAPTLRRRRPSPGARARAARASRATGAEPRSRSVRRAGRRWSDRSSTARAASTRPEPRSGWSPGVAGHGNGPRTVVHGPCRRTTGRRCPSSRALAQRPVDRTDASVRSCVDGRGHPISRWRRAPTATAPIRSRRHRPPTPRAPRAPCRGSADPRPQRHGH